MRAHKQKRFSGESRDSVIIFMVGEDRDVMRCQSGWVHEIWLTGQRGSYYDPQGEHHLVHGMMLRYVGQQAAGTLNLFFEEKPEVVEGILGRMHQLPDNGVDLSMEAPLLHCWIDQPGRHGDGRVKLVLGRYFKNEL